MARRQIVILVCALALSALPGDGRVGRNCGMALAQEMGVPFLGQIPIDPEVVTAGDAGIPLVHDGPQSPAAKAFADVVRSILARDLDSER